ncbi:MAG: AmmeMemoRadiSam system protein B [Gemmatimonadetes bacterium 13_1_40CM_4_69_8]|nr:MAG: AmmeMemoRadiSam system protein B [Gemmatimonadetes bacterium 13_1_40CM_4_69_8]PYP71252.1 MAG: AmmeMemoRadiSam system protein B [Gemmatimonadota bacterium]
MRPPAVSGRFYPGTRAELARTVEDLLAAARPGAHPAGARGAVAPHAGYVYSGMTAAHVFARLRLPPVVVVLAPNHTGVCHAPGGASLWEAGAFATPVGDVPVDDAFATALVDASPLVASDHDAHRAEHAVEVQLPFLLALRPDVRIVPLILAWDGWDDCRALGEALAALARRWTEPVLLLASSDLNHYEPAAVNELKDARALAAVAALDGAELLGRCRREHITMCGRAPVATVLAATQALGATRADVVDYRHSGWVTGDESQVVGYGGVVIL